MPRRVLKGTVVCSSMDKTLSVLVERFVQHKKYGKRIKRRKKYSVHDPGNSHSVGDVVTFIESAPISKTKRWAVYGTTGGEL